MTPDVARLRELAASANCICISIPTATVLALLDMVPQWQPITDEQRTPRKFIWVGKRGFETTVFCWWDRAISDWRLAWSNERISFTPDIWYPGPPAPRAASSTEERP